VYNNFFIGEASMSTFQLPQSSRAIVFLGCAATGLAIVATSRNSGFSVWLLILAFFVSGYLSDLFTGVAHFCFDYVFLYKVPIFGPIAKEFTDHHDHPTLDPSTYWENLTKGSYASLPLSLSVVGLNSLLPSHNLYFFLIATLLGMSIWALFFHQIHSYAHMGCHMSPEVFKKRADEIALLPTKADQVAAFGQLFDADPIPRVIRVLQKSRILLTPELHNIHHTSFETDFSSVYGWSDPLLNLFVAPLARRYKSMTDRVR
jgi:hypothetical protein